MWKSLVSLVGVLIVGACATNPPPFPVEGDSRSLTQLEGEWAGSYAGLESGRSGSIVFRLEAHTDTAFGDVLMIPRNSDRVRDGSNVDGRHPSIDAPQPIAIRFVQVQADSVRGQLDDYRDPDCGCQLRTVFRGQVAADRIQGTFETWHLESGQRQSGTWHVQRQE